MMETRICSNCSQHKPYPVDFITSFLKGTICGQCLECRSKNQKEARKRISGNPVGSRGWKNEKNTFNQRIFERKPTIE